MALFTGDYTAVPYPYVTNDAAILGPDGSRYVHLYARARLTDTLQTSIPLFIPPVKPNSLSGNFPDIPLTIPVGGQIQRVDFRLPSAAPAGEEPVYGINLPRGCTIIGTSTDNLKVSPTATTTHTVTAPVIASANNAYTPGASAVLQRASGAADAASPSLLTTVSGSALTLQISCSNAANAAAGTGIRLSQTGAIAFIYARVIYRDAGDAIKPWNIDLPAMPG